MLQFSEKKKPEVCLIFKTFHALSLSKNKQFTVNTDSFPVITATITTFKKVVSSLFSFKVVFL